jgi:hypothetical protein
MKEKKGVWKLEYLESIPQQDPDEQNDSKETEEST